MSNNLASVKSGNRKIGHHSPSLTRRPLREEHETCEESSGEEIEGQENSPKNFHSSADGEDENTNPNVFEERSASLKYNRSRLVDKLQSPGVSKDENTSPNAVTEQSASSKYIFAALVVVCVLCLSSFFYYPSEEESKLGIDLSKIMLDMENHFNSQPEMTYRFLKVQLRKVINVTHDPPAPAIITFLANKGAEINASEFSRYLAEALVSENYISINDSISLHNDPHDIRLEIDEKVRSKYQQNQLNVIIIDRLHEIPFDAAMIFHGYCDHEHSPFKRAVFMFIIHVNKIIPKNSSGKYLDKLAIDSLKNMWSHATDDKIDSLITRMTVAVMEIN